MAAHVHQCLRVINSVFQGLYMHGYTEPCTHTVVKMHLPPLCPLSLLPSSVRFLCSMLMVRGSLRSSWEAGMLHGPTGRGVNSSSRKGPGGGGGLELFYAAPDWIKLWPRGWSSTSSVADWGGVHSCLMTQRKGWGGGASVNSQLDSVVYHEAVRMAPC